MTQQTLYQQTLVTERHKLVVYRDTAEGELYDLMAATLRAHDPDGIPVPVMAPFNEPDARHVARIRVEDVRRAAIELGRRDDVDGVFISCTNVRAAAVIEEIETATGKPATSSNHALAWHCLRLAGVEDALDGWGALYRKGLA